MPKNAIRSAYNAAKWLPQRRQMLVWWEHYLDAVKAGKKEPPVPHK